MIQCPHCAFRIQVTNARPGTFTPKCPSCGQRFSLIVDGEGATPRVHAEVRSPAATVPPLATTPRHDDPAPAASAAAAQTVPPEGERSRATIAPSGPADDLALKPPPQVYQHAVGRVAERHHTAIMTGRLGGYELKRKLGQGGMGSVYLARQMSLDRDVAVKVLDTQLARDAQFVSRFVREAYAAAQLVHHNVVQIHDIGEDADRHFYSMELVNGQSLADVIRSEGAIEPDTAAGYILQAARGLKLAHDQGMVHRDIKPENLLLSRDGIVKVADLGLVKRAGERETSAGAAAAGSSTSAATTMAHSTMGTPHYMAPEQAEDAANVDARADIYSLGCTLFALLTGRPPFDGPTVDDVLKQAKVREVPPPKMVNPRVPGELSRIVHLMTAHRREDRYANIGLVIRDLEQYLGVEAAGAFTPRQQHVDELQLCVKLFNESSMATVRNVIIGGLIVGAALFTGLLAWDGKWDGAAMIVAMVISTAVIYQLVACLGGKSYLARRLRQLAWHSRWRDWMRWAATAGLGVLAIIVLDMVGPAILVLVVSLIIALLMRVTVDRMVAQQRHHSLARAETLLRSFRMRGLDEDEVRRFVCEYAGRRWEEFFEALFGYEAKLEARKRWGRSARGYGRPKYAAWRDPIIRWIDEREQMLREQRERKHLLRVEMRALQAQGVEEIAAARQAKRMAEMMMAQALELRDQALKQRDEPARTLPPAQEQAVQKPREQFRFDDQAAARGRYRRTGYVDRRVGGPMDLLFGTRTRFVLAAIVLLGFLLWRYENRGAIVAELQQMEAVRIDPVLQDPTKAVDTRKIVEVVSHTTHPLRIWGLPGWLCDAVGSWNGGVAGLILLLGSFIGSIRVGVAIIAAAAICLFGPYLPIAEKLPGDAQTTSLLAGLAVAAMAMVVKRLDE